MMVFRHHYQQHLRQHQHQTAEVGMLEALAMFRTLV
jgi:hypothetical protein